MTTEQTIWSFLKSKNLTDYAVAGIMGNLQAESSLRSNNLEDTRNAQLGSDEIYTRNVDNGSYTRFSFINDGAGYGIAQWTSSDRKAGLYDLCKTNKKSISDLTCQLTFLYEELKKRNLVEEMNKASSIQDASTIFLKKFEAPTNSGIAVQNSRAAAGLKFYNSLRTTSTTQGGQAGKMKYTSSNAPLVCMQTNSTCYKQTSKMAVKGVLWHSTGANNPNIKRYVQPSENDINYSKLITLLGTNTGRNDWNHVSVQAGLNAWIGKLADGTVTSVQTMPWDYKPWGCGSGSKGSCNNGWIQFEICEDSLVDGGYFTKVYNEACELTAYLCFKYGINPKGTVNFNGINVPTILCHQDSAKLGLGSNHADVYHWFNKYGKTMDDVRNDVAKLLGTAPAVTPSTPSSGSIIIPSTSRILRKGMDGDDVKQLQESLIKLGYNLGTWGADGDFGKMTEDAVIKFQQLHGLDDDGEVGPLTIAAINKALEESAKPQIYRVRKTWDQPNTQIGAYTNLANAKKVVDNLKSGYHVYNSSGQLIYPLDETTPATPVTPSSGTVTPAKTYSDVMIGSASKDENGKYVGGQAGDQTGKEVYVLNWYNQNWNIVLRPKTDVLAEKIAQQCEAGCANNNIGYSQSARNTIYVEAQKVGLDLSKISTPCNCDCSSFVGTICVCAGLPAKYFYQGNMPTTSNMRSCCVNSGEFLVLTGNQYTRQKDYLKRGDILLNESQHVVVVLADGSKVEKTSTPATTPTKDGFPYKVKITSQALNVRKSPTENSEVTAQVRHGYVFTIVDEKEGWGKLKSGAGWINLTYTQKV